jgi:hypothetical protein
MKRPKGMTMDSDQIAEGERLLAAATPGAWRTKKYVTRRGYINQRIGDGMYLVATLRGDTTKKRATAALIVYAVNHLPALLKAARELSDREAKVQKLRRQLARSLAERDEARGLLAQQAKNKVTRHNATQAMLKEQRLRAERAEAEVERLREENESLRLRRCDWCGDVTQAPRWCGDPECTYD